MKKNRFALIMTLGTLTLAAAGCSSQTAAVPSDTAAASVALAETTAASSAASGTSAPAAAPSESPAPAAAPSESPAPAPAAQNGGAGNAISQDEAKAKALEAAQVSEADTLAITIHPDLEEGRPVYSVDIYTPSADYEYELDQATGGILGMEQESYSLDWATPQGAAVTKEDAAAAALQKVPGTTEANLRMMPDFDDGRSVYEGEIVYQDKSYEFKIDCQSGAFLEWSEELLSR